MTLWSKDDCFSCHLLKMLLTDSHITQCCRSAYASEELPCRLNTCQGDLVVALTCRINPPDTSRILDEAIDSLLVYILHPVREDDRQAGAMCNIVDRT